MKNHILIFWEALIRYIVCWMCIVDAFKIFILKVLLLCWAANVYFWFPLICIEENPDWFSLDKWIKVFGKILSNFPNGSSSALLEWCRANIIGSHFECLTKTHQCKSEITCVNASIICKRNVLILTKQSDRGFRMSFIIMEKRHICLAGTRQSLVFLTIRHECLTLWCQVCSSPLLWFLTF